MAAFLAELPANRPACTAYAAGTDTIDLMHLLVDRRELIERTTEAFLAGYWSIVWGARHLQPS